MELNESELLIEISVPTEEIGVSELAALLSKAPIRVTHKPSGISAIGEGQGSQVKNKEMAMKLLREHVSKWAEQRNSVSGGDGR